MGKRVKFNVHDIFMESQNTVADRTLFVSSPLFAPFAALYNRAEGKIKVGPLVTTVNPDGTRWVKSVPIVTALGLNIAEFMSYTSDYDSLVFNVYHNPFDSNFTSNKMRTSNAKYFQSRLSRNSSHEVAASFDHAMDRASKIFNNVIWRMIHSSISKKFGQSDMPIFDPRNVANGHMITFLARFFAGEVQQSEMRGDYRTEFDNMFNRYREKCVKFKDALKETYDMISTEKFFYVPDMNGGVLLGAIRPEPMCAALDTFIATNSLPMSHEFNYIQETLPFKWYPSHEHIPEDIRQQLDFSLVMLKAHTGSAGDLRNRQSEQHYYELGCYCSGDSAPVYVLTK